MTRSGTRLRSSGRVVRTTGRVAVALLAIVTLVGTGYAHITYDRLRGDIGQAGALEPRAGEHHEAPAEEDMVDVLIVGTDARTDMQGNPLSEDMLRELGTEHKDGVKTDTLIILRLPEDGGEAHAVSIPRDIWVDTPGGDKGKINSVFGAAKQAEKENLLADGVTGGAELEQESDQAGRRALVQAVEDLTEVRIDHYVEVSMLGFYLLTEALGGVEVCLNSATSDPDAAADFAAGRQVVKGGDALSFVRQRKNLPRGDLDRIARQQAFLASALDEAFSTGTLTNRDRLDELAEAARRSVVLDPDLDLLEFAEQLRAFASGRVDFVTIPVLDIAASGPGGESIVEVDVEEVRSFVAELAAAGSGSDPGSEAGDGGAEPRGGGSAAPAPSGEPGDEPISADGVACVD
ncbi:LCP family protein [Haloechinothrix sp. YIM 98757]|uniref:LCP family protein n=1 Tax=Haloechinothrix aidingensis TaxID=2752311 RepID=A0A838AF92_9PSEU|nr:LCP family protein [Haloechinothrix aidingensis]MBA0128024.1 LCP family protein [Haloechinothrix aidingensis]